MSKDTTVNKQIEQLALQCGAWNQVYSNRMFMIDEHFDIEKFAELIVKECANVANQHMEHNEGTDYNVGGKIKQHFGVEE